MTPWRFQLVPLEVVGGPQHSVDSHGRGASARIEENFFSQNCSSTQNMPGMAVYFSCIHGKGGELLKILHMDVLNF